MALMADLDAKATKKLYASYVRSFWLDRKVLAGLAEWPRGSSPKQDMDSGPVIMGIGSAATAMGIAAAGAGGDPARRGRLMRQALMGKQIIKMLSAASPKKADAHTLGGRIDLDSPYCTGFLFGDACLFYSVTWRPWLSGGKE
jgi:hypothetical protein